MAAFYLARHLKHDLSIISQIERRRRADHDKATTAARLADDLNNLGMVLADDVLVVHLI